MSDLSKIATSAYMNAASMPTTGIGQDSVATGANFDSILKGLDALDLSSSSATTFLSDAPYTPSSNPVSGLGLMEALSSVPKTAFTSLRNAESMSLLAAQEKIESSQIVPAVAEAKAALDLFTAGFSTFQKAWKELASLNI